MPNPSGRVDRPLSPFYPTTYQLSHSRPDGRSGLRKELPPIPVSPSLHEDPGPGHVRYGPGLGIAATPSPRSTFDKGKSVTRTAPLRISRPLRSVARMTPAPSEERSVVVPLSAVLSQGESPVGATYGMYHESPVSPLGTSIHQTVAQAQMMQHSERTRQVSISGGSMSSYRAPEDDVDAAAPVLGSRRTSDDSPRPYEDSHSGFI